MAHAGVTPAHLHAIVSALAAPAAASSTRRRGGTVRWGGQQFGDPGSLVAWINRHGGQTNVADFLARHPGAASIFAGGAPSNYVGAGAAPAALPGDLINAPLPGAALSTFSAQQAAKAGLQHTLGPPIAPPGPAFLGPPVHPPPQPPGLLGPPVRRGPRFLGSTNTAGANPGPGLPSLPPRRPPFPLLSRTPNRARRRPSPLLQLLGGG